jgi:ketosteroid isomerase-like protein
MRAAAILLLVTLFACSRAETPPPSDEARVEADTKAARAEIEANSAKLDRFLSSGDIDSAAAMLTDDYRFHPPNAPAGSGREGFKTTVKGMLSAWTITDSGTTESVIVSGPLAMESGRFVMTFAPTASAPKGAKAFADTGKYLWAWRKVNGSWLLAQASWNSDLPVKP